jgi:hypothetical protein
MVDSLLRLQARDDSVFLADPIRRDHQRDVAAHRLFGGVAEHPFGRRIPTLNSAVKRLADDGVVGRLNDRSEQTGGQELPGSFLFHSALIGHVPENQHASRNRAVFVPDRSRAVVNGQLVTVFPHQHGVVGETDNDAFAERPERGVGDRLTCGFVDDSKDVVQRATECSALCPPGQRLGNGVHRHHTRVDIGRNHCVTDASERHSQQLAAFVCGGVRTSCRLAKADDQAARKQIREQSDQSSDPAEGKMVSGLDEQVVARDIAEEDDEHRGPGAAQPLRRGNSTEERDERQRVAHPGIEDHAQQDGGNKRYEGQRMDRCRAALFCD